MKKGICLAVAAALCVMLLTACGNSNEQKRSENNQEQVTNSSTVQDSTKENQEVKADETETQQEAADEAEVQQETADISDVRQEAESVDDNQQEVSNETDDQTGKVLVVYYSASGNTKAVGDIIAQYTGGDVFEIIPVDEYTSEDLDWREAGSRVNLEHEDESLQDIELVSTTVDNFEAYDTVFIGYPIWWREAAWVVNNFVKDNDFTGKTVIPFCTSASSEMGESGTNLAAMAGTGDWKEGQRFDGSAEESEITEWLDGLDL